MQNPPSLTAKNVAPLRAAHQLIFPDPLAVPITCENVPITRFVQEHPEFDRLRLFTAARSRFAEDHLASAMVVACDRQALNSAVKARVLAKANLKIPSWLNLVTVDFEQQNFIESFKAGK